jgi:hypothetical protein
MRTLCRVVGLCVYLALLAACAKLAPPAGGGPAPQPVSVNAQKYFTISVTDAFFGGCKVEVRPDKKPGKVRLDPKMRVAWIAANECSEEVGVELMQFKQGNRTLQAEDIFDDIVRTDYTWTGTVKEDTKEILGRWKYTAGVGTHMKDPDIIIF